MTTLITGASRGLGRGTAKRLVHEGHVVYLGVRGRRVADDLGARPLQIDVTDDTSVDAAAARLTAGVGQSDVLINNAGIAGEQRRPAEADVADTIRVVTTNVHGPTRMLKVCAPLLDASPTPVVVKVTSAVGSLTRSSEPE